MEALILKNDLVKAYDRVDWTMLRLILLQVGVPYSIVKWIMDCVSSENCVVLVNGNASDFFCGGRGLRQGFPLSPLLFLLLIEGLIRLFGDEKDHGLITGIHITML